MRPRGSNSPSARHFKFFDHLIRRGFHDMARLSAIGFVFASGLALLAPFGAAQAQQMKIGFVNVPRLLEEAPQAKGAMQALQDEFAPRQREIVAQQKDLKTKEEKLQRD